MSMYFSRLFQIQCYSFENIPILNNKIWENIQYINDNILPFFQYYFLYLSENCTDFSFNTVNF